MFAARRAKLYGDIIIMYFLFNNNKLLQLREKKFVKHRRVVWFYTIFRNKDSFAFSPPFSQIPTREFLLSVFNSR